MQADFWGNNSLWFWTFMQFVTVTVTLMLIYRQVRVQTASHIVQALTAIYNRWNSEPMLRARQKVCQQWLAQKRDFDGVAEYVAEFMEELGIYLRTRAEPAREMWEAQSWYVEHYYWMFKPGIEGVRQRYKDQNLYPQFEMLLERMNELNRKHLSPAFQRGEQELNAFAESEIAVADAIIRLRSDRATLP